MCKKIVGKLVWLMFFVSVNAQATTITTTEAADGKTTVTETKLQLITQEHVLLVSLIVISIGTIIALFSGYKWYKKASDSNGITIESTEGGQNVKGAATAETIGFISGVFIIMVGYLVSTAELVLTATLP